MMLSYWLIAESDAGSQNYVVTPEFDNNLWHATLFIYFDQFLMQSLEIQSTMPHSPFTRDIHSTVILKYWAGDGGYFVIWYLSVVPQSKAKQNNVVLSPAEVNQAEEAPKQIRGYQNIGSHLIEHTCPTFLSKNTFLSSVQSMNTVCQTIWSKYSWNYNKLLYFWKILIL